MTANKFVVRRKTFSDSGRWTTGEPSSRASKRIAVLGASNARCSENMTVYSLA
jgi:hypothetical protein